MERRHDDTLDLRLPPARHDTRRRQAGDLVLEDQAVARFNALLADLAPQAPRVSADQVATRLPDAIAKLRELQQYKPQAANPQNQGQTTISRRG